MSKLIGDEREMNFLAEAILEKFRNDLKTELLAEAEKVIDKTLEQIEETIDLEANGAIHRDSKTPYIPYAHIVISVKDARSKNDNI